MQSVAFAVGLLAGQAGAVRVALACCQAGGCKQACQDARRRAGIIRKAVWIQTAPGGDAAVVYLEAGDRAAAFTVVARFTAETRGSGKTISCRGLTFYRLAGGKIVEDDPVATPDLAQEPGPLLGSPPA